jgi:hypothetical protein
MVISEIFPQNLTTLAHISSATNPGFFWSPLCEILKKRQN